MTQTGADERRLFIDLRIKSLRYSASSAGSDSFAKPEHELKMILSRFLFPFGTWDKSCSKLSGGEKMRLVICCLMVSNSTPDVIILDEPTNNLDIQSVHIVTTAIKDYKGTVLLVSHDLYFVKEIKTNRTVELFSSTSVIKI